ncbi:bi-domain-containing oxidoreductase [Candidatus Dependentiae bacterium]
MKQVFLKKGKAHLCDVPIPCLQSKNVLVKVCYSFISSGTEIATLKASEKSLIQKFISNSKENTTKFVGAIKDNGISGTIALVKGKLKSLGAVGYSCSGHVIAVGQGVKKIKPGDYVACGGASFANHAQMISVPENLVVKIKKEENIKHASLTTIGSIAMQGVRRAELRLGETVCVFGLGLLGQITVQLAKLSGCRVIGIDLQQDRLDLAKKLGSDFVFNPSNVDIKNEIKFLTSHYGVDTTIITAASSSGIVIDLSMSITRRKGKVVLVGDVKLDFNREDFYSKEIDFLISCSYGPGRYDSSYELQGNDYPYSYVRWTENRNMELFLDLIENKKISIDPLISCVFDLEETQKAYDFLKSHKSLGVVLSFTESLKNESLQDVVEKLVHPKDTMKSYVAPKEKIKIGFVGVGGFAKVKLLPIISKNKNIELRSFVDTNSANLLNSANLYDVKNISSDYRRIMLDDQINAVVFATPHSQHFEQTISALENGKAVFVEKPAVVSFEELSKLEEFFLKNKNSFYCVDFNRSFAPFNLAIKKELVKRKNPMIINYRMNAGFIPKDHWIQSNKNGGRIIGEACHIFELFCFLTDAKPTNISVSSLNSNTDDYSVNDNVLVNLMMDDGSCCCLLYTAIGSKLMNKERMEIFVDGKSIVLKDYKTLNGYGFPISFNKKTNYPDKGHYNLLSEFIKLAKIKNSKPPISVERILLATKISLIADKLARQGGGSIDV